MTTDATEVSVISQLDTPGNLGRTLEAERKEFDQTTPAMRRAPLLTAICRIKIVHNNRKEMAFSAVY